MMRIKDVLELESLSRAQLLTDENTKNNVVNSVNIMDAPDINNWIKKNELLLTTGFSIYTRITDLDKFIKNLVKSGCAGLGIKPNRFFDNIPEEIIKSADKYGLPVIEIPNDIILGQVLKEILVEISIKHRFEADNIIPLLNNCLDFKNINKVVNLIGNAVNFNISLESAFINKKIDYRADDETEDSKADFKKEVFVIKKQNIVLGKMIISTSKDNIYRLKKLPVINFGLNILEFLLDKKRLELSRDFELRNDILDKLINYKTTDDDNLLEELNLLNLDLYKKDIYFQIITASYKENEEEKILLQNKLKKIINNFESEFKGKSDIKLLGGIHKSQIVFVLVIKDDKTINFDYIELYTDYLNYLSELYFPNQNLVLGISSVEQKISKISILYLQSVKANNIAYERKNNVFKYKDIGILEKIYDPENGVTLKKIMNDNFGSLADHNNFKEYIESLKVYFENDENLNKAAAALYIHRNSLKYRLNKIEKITNKNINNLEDKFKLYTGIKAYEILN